MARMTRAAYAATYGPTTGDLVRLGDTSLLAEIERDHAVYGDECMTGAGKVMRDGMGFDAHATAAAGALDMLVQNATIIDPVLGVVKGGHRDPQRHDRRGGQGRQPGHPVGRPSRAPVRPLDHHRPRGPAHRHAGWRRGPRPLPLPPAVRARAGRRAHHHRGRHHGPALRHQLRRPDQPRHHAAGGRAVSAQLRVPRARQRPRPRRHRGERGRRRHRREGARGLRRHAGHDRLRADRRRPPRLPGAAAHRHHQRGRLLRGHHRRHRRPHDPHVPRGGRGRRPRPRHHPRGRRSPLPALVDQSDQSLHAERPRRGFTDDDGRPLPQLAAPRGRGLRREPGAPADDGRRGPAARPRGDLDLRRRHAGHGAGHRDGHQLLAARERHEGPQGPAARPRPRRGPTTSGSSATSPSTPSTRPGRSASIATWGPSSPARWPTSSCGPRPSSGSSRSW